MRTPLSAIAVVLMICARLAGAAEPRFGELPAGSISISETHDVSAEICRDHIFDPARAGATLPGGYRLTPASEFARKDPALAALLLKHPRLRNYAMGSLCFMSVGRLEVDGTSVHSGPPLPLAFWWAASEGPSHKSMRGKTEWVQLKSWYPSTITNRVAVLATDPMAEFVDIRVEQVQFNKWRLRLDAQGETVTAEIAISGEPVLSRAAQPGYMSVPMSGQAANYFTVFTYFGHRHQKAQGAWQAAGAGVFSEAFAIEGGAETLGTVFQAGWSARSGLYRFSSK